MRKAVFAHGLLLSTAVKGATLTLAFHGESCRMLRVSQKVRARLEETSPLTCFVFRNSYSNSLSATVKD